MKKLLFLLILFVGGLSLSSCVKFDPAKENKENGEKFLENNAKREGVIVRESGLQYEVVQQGTGRTPTINDVVLVNYQGCLIDGSVFDSSFERGKPETFNVKELIPGWQEGLTLMNEGSKYRFFIPYYLAYGSRGLSIIPPYAALVFDVELIKVM